jgi:hypothetical protein
MLDPSTMANPLIDSCAIFAAAVSGTAIDAARSACMTMKKIAVTPEEASRPCFSFRFCALF